MKQKEDVIIRIAGAAGDGIASIGEVLGKICSRQGLHVMAYNDYQSAIRGGHVWLQLNIGSKKTLTHGESPDIEILLSPTSPSVHLPVLKKGGLVLYNAAVIKEDLARLRKGISCYGLDLKKLTEDSNISPVMGNTLLLGALIQLLGFDIQLGLDFLKDRFAAKGEKVVQLNLQVLTLGATWAKENIQLLNLKLKGDQKKRLFLTGNHALGMGLLCGGLKFYAGYPMSPSSGILHYVANKAKSYKIIMKQTEDELAAVNFVIGASHAGVRAATATSGGGFSLMTEAIGLAGMMEEGIVVINVQRGGPSTGLPTKQEQGDLNQLLGASQGDFPRIILAPKDTEDAFYTAWRALNLAEKYQTPVLVLADAYLSEHFQTVDSLKLDMPVERGKLLQKVTGEYKRYKMSADGVSPRLIPGAPQGMYCSASDEHDESGGVISDVLAGLPSALEVRNKMHAKRMRKLETIREHEMKLPTLTGPKKASLTLMGWGSSYDAIEEAIGFLAEDGMMANHLHFTDLFPLPAKGMLKIMKSCKKIIAVENNYSSQMSRLIRAETGYEIQKSVNRYDGEPFTGEYIYNRVKKEWSHGNGR